jgi:hypothetical protein
MKENNYSFPKGDFLSGFSEGNEPCDYELECQRMVIRGVEYLDENPALFNKIGLGGMKVSHPDIQPMIDYMCGGHQNKDEDSGQTGAMLGHTVKVAYHAKKLGWNNYIKKITETYKKD